jgi:hypothetical protein
MRKAFGVLFAASLFASVGAWAAGPAGAVAKGPTCKAFSSTELTSPGLPIVTSTKKVNATVKTTGKLTGCTGIKGITGAAITQTYKYNGNCLTLFTGKGGKTTPAKPTTTFTWTNHKTSTAMTTTKLLTKSGVVPAKLKLVTKITKGLFSGTSSTGTITLTTPAGSCVTKPGAKATLTGGKTIFK